MERNTSNVRKWRRLVVLLFCLLLIGCSGEDKKPNVDTEETQESQDLSDYVVWAIPKSGPVNELSEDTMEEINRKLKEDGYAYQLKLLYVEEEKYLDRIQGGDVDIASTGLDVLRQFVDEQALRDGIFERLDDRLKGSRLYDAIPELLWESVRYQGSVCCIPKEAGSFFQTGLFVRTDQIPEGFPEHFDGDIMELEDYLSEDCKLYWGAGVSYFYFAENFGYVFDRKGGVLVKEDGSCVNPLEVEQCVEWLRTVNRWYHEGKVDIDNPETCSMAFDYNTSVYQTEEWQKCYSRKAYICHNTLGTVGILADSDKKDEAFALLELFHTDPSYGNLLTFGKEALEKGKETHSLTPRVIFGLDTGLQWGVSTNYNHFSSSEEMKQYYQENILPSPSIYMIFPEESKSVQEIIRTYLADVRNNNEIGSKFLLASDDFDATLQEFQDEIKEPMDAVLHKLGKQEL